MALGAMMLRCDCDCASDGRAIAMTAMVNTSAVANWMRNLILESPLQSDGRALAGATCSPESKRARLAVETRYTSRTTVKVSSNIGSGRIGTLLFFVTKRIHGKIVQTGSTGKVCAIGKVSHSLEARTRSRSAKKVIELVGRTMKINRGDRRASGDRHQHPARASGARDAICGDGSADDGDGRTTRGSGRVLRAWQAVGSRQNLASRQLP